jgi:hypothetical protein
MKAKVAGVFRQNWAPWIKKLLAHLIKAYFPTVDSGWAVIRLGKLMKTATTGALKVDPTVIETPQAARLCGHFCAWRDYILEKQVNNPSADFDAGWFPDNPNLATHSVLGSILEGKDLNSRAELMRAFSYAYAETFTPLGELRGKTDATAIYVQLLIFALYWTATRPPSSVAELHKWMLSRRPQRKLSKLEELRQQDADHKDLLRLQQICKRLGLRFRHGQKPR